MEPIKFSPLWRKEPQDEDFVPSAEFQSAAGQIRENVEAQMRGAILATVYELFQQEVDQLCGPMFASKGTALAHRAGSDPGSILAPGQRMGIEKPRAKRAGQEVEMETYKALQAYDVLCERVLGHMISGVSTRDYDGLLEEVAGGVGLKKSSVSSAFVKASRDHLMNSIQEISAPSALPPLWLTVGFGDRTVIRALGITVTGEKLLLGLREGATENWEIARDLFDSLIARGLKHDERILFIIAGGKALKKSILKVFCPSPIQRCVRHIERNITSYLPEDRHIEFRRRWKSLRWRR